MAYFIFFIVLSVFVTQSLSTCTSLSVRKDWRSLSEVERSNFINAQQKLWRMSTNPSTGFSVYDTNFTMLHRDSTPLAHLVPQFLPWHRRFLRDYELALRGIDPTVSLPYWNWADDNTRLNESLVFDDKYFGGDGVGADHCVQNGRYANWSLSLGGDLADASIDIEHCLRRIWSRGISSPRHGLPPVVPDMTDIARNITSFNQTFALFRSWWENPHGTIHLGVGGFSEDLNGDLTAVENSPNDPIFWLHHTFIDKVWWQFQQQSNVARDSYGGFPSARANIPKNSSTWTTEARVTDLMSPWQVTVESAMRADVDGYCYSYE